MQWGWSIFYDHFKVVIKYANIAMISYIFIVIKIYSINIKHKLRLKSI